MSDPGSAPDLGSFLPARRGGISATEIDGELVLLDTSTGTLHVLNHVAAAVWAALDGDSGVDAIVAAFSEAAGADPEQVREDVIRLIDQLGQNDLLAAQPPSYGTD